jgi:hypothetical protein
MVTEPVPTARRWGSVIEMGHRALNPYGGFSTPSRENWTLTLLRASSLGGSFSIRSPLSTRYGRDLRQARPLGDVCGSRGRGSFSAA